MDLNTPKYYEPSPLFTSSKVVLESEEGKTKGNPFAEALKNNNADPICKLNLKETSDFVKSLPMNNCNGTQSVQRRRENVGVRKMEAPSTPGRPVFSFSVSRKSVPSKWEDAEKWLFNGGGTGASCHESPAHHHHHHHHNNNNHNNMIKQNEGPRNSHSKAILNEIIAEKFRVIEEKKITKETLPKFINCTSAASLEDHHHQQKLSSSITFNGVIIPADLPLKDKFTDEIGPFSTNCRYSEPTKEAFLFKNHRAHNNEAMTDACTEVIPIQEVKHRDMGTEMTPIGSNTTSRCHTPFKSISPARHNTPASRSGLLALVGQPTIPMDMAQLQECHLAKLQIGTTQFDSVATNWSSREEEEEEISKSLRHFEIGRRSSVSEPRVSVWEEEEMTKFCLRYQREEAKIQAWVNLQNAKAEAQSKKLEVKIQKMRSNLEEKLMRKMAIVNRKAEELRASAQVEHSEQIRRAAERSQKLMLNHHHHHRNSHLSPHIISCGCFPCTSK
ncbi:hypothetical protein BVRB_7g169140 [Beta vulgaris subsp. vulgaris]|nr:hypothetical protein BVRB_7g169140 [Beta vulgaris subsp. vulgaris]